ncbi:MAG: hypothetical protein V1851_03285 [Patescibacteria group bacterium]
MTISSIYGIPFREGYPPSFGRNISAKVILDRRAPKRALVDIGLWT